MIRRVLFVLLILGAAPALAQESEAPPRLEPVVVTTTRMEQRASEAPASVTVIDRAARVTGYWNEVQDLIANVTLARRLADCPVGTTCRQRQNLDLARIRGIETEVELRLARAWRLIASNAAVTARVVGRQFEDDLNTLPLGSDVVFDVVLSRAITKWAEAFFAIENAFDTVYSTGRTSEGVVSTGAPFLAHGGIRLAF